MKPDALRAAAEVLRYWELRQQVTTNNLANAETPGFKAERVFARLLADETLDMGSRTDLRAGALRPTSNPLDVALEGADRFLVVATRAGERLSRGGALRLDTQHRLVDALGDAVLGEEGPIVVPDGAPVEIGADGSVRAGGEVLDRLRVVRPAAGDSLTHEAGSRFVARQPTVDVEGADRGVRAGALEDSNTSTLDAMVELINIQRAYGAVQSGVRTLDGVLDTIANRIGRVG
jgi:flagellar basal body rod protein FlgG